MELSFNHMPKNMTILTDLVQAETSVGRAGDSCWSKGKIKKSKSDKKWSTNLGYPHAGSDDRTRYGLRLGVFRAEMCVVTHDGTGARAVLGRLADQCKDVTPLRQIALSFDHGRCATDLQPKDFPGVGSPMNLERAKNSSTGVRIEAIVLYLLGDKV